MECLSLLIVLTMSVLLVQSDPVYEKPQDLVVGHRYFDDYLLQQMKVEKSGWPFIALKDTVTLEGDGVRRISGVEIIDLKPEGHSAEPTIVRGGTGKK